MKNQKKRKAISQREGSKIAKIKTEPIEEKTEKLELLDEDPENLAELSDSSDEEMKNRIGNVPLEWYNEYDHIGYDVHGQQILKKVKGDALDDFLARRDNKDLAMRTVYDKVNDEHIVLNNEELKMIRNLRKNKPLSTWEPTADPNFYSNKVEVTALGPMFEPKRRFIPSRWEAAKIVKLVHAIRNGWLKVPDESEEKKTEEEEEEDEGPGYLLWGDDGKSVKGPGTLAIPAPKALPPGHAESYNPPPEYLPSPEEKAAWAELDREDRPYNFAPTSYDSLRDVPLYRDFIKERFDRCLDLYLCPRVQKKRLKNVDPESLIPQLPKPQDLRPFPTVLALEFLGHTQRVRSISISPNGQWLASGGDDSTVRIWEIDTGRCFKIWKFGEVIDLVAWNPSLDGAAGSSNLLAIAVGNRIVIVNTQIGTQTDMEAAEKLITIDPVITIPPESQKKKKEKKDDDKKSDKKTKEFSWKRSKDVAVEAAMSEPPDDLEEEKEKKEEDEYKPEWREGWSRVSIWIGKRTKALVWHAKGDYLASASPEVSSNSVIIHRISTHSSQPPFTKSKGSIQKIQFHPTKPFFLVATQKNVRIYNLIKQQLVKKLIGPARWISSLGIHPQGDHVLIGSYDRKVCWYDLDLAATPYRTLKYHKKAVRAVTYHPTYPLFATGSDDGKVHIFHSMVYNDLLTNPLIVPVKALEAHEVRQDLGVLDCCFHPQQPWIVTAGADHVIRLFA